MPQCYYWLLRSLCLHVLVHPWCCEFFFQPIRGSGSSWGLAHKGAAWVTDERVGQTSENMIKHTSGLGRLI